MDHGAFRICKKKCNPLEGRMGKKKPQQLAPEKKRSQIPNTSVGPIHTAILWSKVKSLQDGGWPACLASERGDDTGASGDRGFKTSFVDTRARMPSFLWGKLILIFDTSYLLSPTEKIYQKKISIRSNARCE